MGGKTSILKSEIDFFFFKCSKQKQQENFNISGLLPACHFSFSQVKEEKHRVK